MRPPEAQAESVPMHAVGVRHGHRRGAPPQDKVRSVVVSLAIGVLVGPFLAWGLLEVMEARLARAGVPVSLGALVVTAVGSVLVVAGAAFAARRSGVGSLVGGVVTVAASVIGLADRAIGHGSPPDSLPAPVAYTALILFGFGTLLPLAATLIGLGPASAIAGHRVPAPMLWPSVLAAVGVVAGMWAAIWAGTRIHAEIAPLGYDAISGRDVAVVLGGLVLLGLATVLGGRGAPGLIVAGVTFVLAQVAFLSAPESAVAALPGWVVRALDIPGLVILPMTGLVLVGGGIGLLMRRSALARTIRTEQA